MPSLCPSHAMGSHLPPPLPPPDAASSPTALTKLSSARGSLSSWSATLSILQIGPDSRDQGPHPESPVKRRRVRFVHVDGQEASHKPTHLFTFSGLVDAVLAAGDDDSGTALAPP